MRVLVTGGNGFVASHCIRTLLQRGHSVVFTVRSRAKGDLVLQTLPSTPREQLSYTVVPDITVPDAFDHAVKPPQFSLPSSSSSTSTTTASPFDGILHIASPYHFRISDRQKELLDPAILGTTGLLQSIHTHAPTVKRVVITSSFAALVTVKSHPEIYHESSWNDTNLHEALNTDLFTAWRASKTFAERAAWSFVEEKTPSFDICTINPPLVFGPPLLFPTSSLASDEDSQQQRQRKAEPRVNTSNQRILDMMFGKMRNGLAPTGIYLWVDVRDLALAHVRALEVPEAGGKRVLCTAGYFTNADIANTIRKTFAELMDKVPEKEMCVPDLVDEKTGKPSYGFDNSRSRDVLGLEYREIEESVVDTVRKLLEVMQQMAEGVVESDLKCKIRWRPWESAGNKNTI